MQPEGDVLSPKLISLSSWYIPKNIRQRERQVHKWSRAKKERLIKGELPYMRHLSTNAQDPAIDMGDWTLRDSKGYRVPADNRTSNSTNSITTTTSTAAEQGRSITEGDEKRCELSEFNSDTLAV